MRNRQYFRGGWVKLKGLAQSGHWPSGNPRYYLRRKGQKAVPMPDAPRSSPVFLAAYVEATDGAAPTTASHAKGTLGAAVTAYRASPEWRGLADGTRRSRIPHLDEIAGKYGAAKIGQVRQVHVRRALADHTAHAANNRLRAWKALFKWLCDRGEIEENPIASMSKRAGAKSGGFRAWTRDDLAAFRAHWSHDTPQRLALELMYRSCAAMGDACLLGPANIRGNWLEYTRQKSGSGAVVPWRNAPAWFEWTDDFERCLAAQGGGHMVWLVTAQGKPRSHKAASQWFSRACTEAGLAPDLSAHGLRKLRGAMMREMGATVDQRKPILGHETDGEAEKYAKSADAKVVILGREMKQAKTMRNNRKCFNSP